MRVKTAFQGERKWPGSQSRPVSPPCSPSGLFVCAPASAESIMKQCGDEWKAAKAANTTNGQTWRDFLKDCRTAPRLDHRRPPPAPARRPAPAPSLRRRPAPHAHGDAHEPDPTHHAPASSPARARRRAIARPTRWSGSTTARTSITIPATVITARPSTAPICARARPRPPETPPPRTASRRAEAVRAGAP